MDERLLLVDSASQYYRAFHGVPASVVGPDRRPVNAVRGFFAGLTRLVQQTRSTRLVLAWDDDWRPAFRTGLLPAYKAHRLAPDGTEQTPPDLLPQVELIVALAAALGLARVGVAGFEADDVIATIAAREIGPVAVVTGDRDLFQVIDDARDVSVWYTGKGAPEVVTEAGVRLRYGVTAAQYAEFALLRGDPSDGLPGVRGIGEKGAARLLAEHGSLANLLAAAGDAQARLTPAVRRALVAAEDYVSAAGPVVRVRLDVPLPRYDDRLRGASAAPGAVRELVERTGLRSTVDRWLETVRQLTVE